MKTKVIFLYIGLFVFLSNAFAQKVEIGGIAYSLSSDRTASVTSKAYSGDITIPSTITYNGINYSVTSIGDSAFYSCSLTSITIPNSVTSIRSSAFELCSGLTSITIPNSVTSIGSSAFERCNRLTSITIPNSVTSIGSRAFTNCRGLTSITIPNSVTSIGETAFYYCSGLTSITIPNSVTSIGNAAFGHCMGLTSIIVESGNSKYDSRNNCNAIINSSTNNLIAGCKNTIIPNGVTSIDDDAFSGCYGLTSITIPNSVTSIGDYAFGWCKNLTSFIIPNSVTSIGHFAFHGCSGLPSITIPNSVTYMGYMLFPHEANDQLSYIFVDNPTPPYLHIDSWYSDSFYNSVTLCVPAAAINAYRNASVWGNFQNINPLPSVTVHADHGDATISYHSPTDVEVLITPHYGYHFTQWSDGNTDNPRSVNVAQNATYTAKFAKNSYKITTQSTISQVCAISAPTQAEYLDRVEIFVSILEPTYRFRCWNDGNTENPRSFVLTQDTAFTATVNNQYVLSGMSEHGTITGAGEYPYGSYVMLAVIPDNGYKFVRWSDGTIYNPYSLVLEEDFSVEAIMEPIGSEVDEHESADHSAKKIMKDGVIYIIKNGRTYNLYGTLIEGTE